jgi:hypothetical protein
MNRMDYFHLDYRSVDFFVGRLQTRLRQSASAVLRARFARWDPDIHGEPALAVVAKIEMLNRVLARLNADVAQLVEYLNSVPEAVEQCICERRALSVPNRNLLWHLSVDVDSFLFEARSAYEVLGRFLKEFFRLIFERNVTELEVIEAVKTLGGDVAWVAILKESRNLFLHNAASWLAVERTQDDPPQFDLLLLKRNVEDLADDDFVHFHECRAVQRGLAECVNKISLWIVNEIAAVEQEDAAAQDSGGEPRR